MENFKGVASLFIACMELVLVLNMIIFAKKNKMNLLIISFVGLLMLDQLFEFTICYFNVAPAGFLAIKFALFSLIPALLLHIVFEVYQGSRRLHYLFYPPVVVLIAVFLFSKTGFGINSCSLFFASYEFPGRDYLGAFIYLSFILSTTVLFLALGKKVNHKKIIIVIFAGLTVSVLPATIAFLLSSSINGVRESLLSKSAVILALTLTYYTLKNRNEINKKELEQ